MFWKPVRLSLLEYMQDQDPERKRRDDLQKLRLLERLIKRGGMTAKLFEKKDRPYLFVWSHIPGMRGGAKIYQEGEEIAFKFQTGPRDKGVDGRAATDQYETARTLPVQQIFLDNQAESDKTEMQVAIAMADEVARRLKNFFKEMATAIRVRARDRDRHDGDGTPSYITPSSSDYGNSMDRPM